MKQMHHPNNRNDRCKEIYDRHKTEQRYNQTAAVYKLSVLAAQFTCFCFTEMIPGSTLEKLTPKQITIHHDSEKKTDPDKIKRYNKNIEE